MITNKRLKAKKTSKKEKVILKGAAEFTEQDIADIIKLGKDKYTLKEISEMLSLVKNDVAQVLDENKIVVPKKPNNIQRLYEQGMLQSDQFYIEASSLIKSRLMPDLIYKGYFRDGQRQISYNIEDVNDCYTYVLRKIIDKYNPKKGTLATFIRTWTRGYGTTITTAQHRRYKKVGNDASLDENYNNSIKEEFRDAFNYQDLEDSIDQDYFNTNELTYKKPLEKEMGDLKASFFKIMLRGLED